MNNSTKVPAGKFEQLRIQAQEFLKQHPADVSKFPTDMLELIEELNIHQAELEIQNEELKHANREIASLHEEYADLYELAPCGYVTLNPKGLITRINRAGAILLGLEFNYQDLLGLSYVILPEFHEIYHHTLAQAGESGNLQSISLKLRRKDDSAVWVQADIRADRDASGELIQWRLTLADITLHKRVEDQFAKHNLRLEQDVSEKQQEMEGLFEKMLRHERLATIGKLSGSMAHELRNPLAVIDGSIYYLNSLAQQGKLEGSNPKVTKYLASIKRQIYRAEQVIDDTLAIARLKPVNCTDNDLRYFIKNAISSCNIPENIQTILELNPDPFHVWTDFNQTEQVLINLLNNAVQAIEGEGKVTIRAQEMTDEAAVLIEIIDTGNGIQPTDLENVFEPLFSTKPFGTGLGLCICKEIVENHGGRISISSEPGQGTTIGITLPTREEK